MREGLDENMEIYRNLEMRLCLSEEKKERILNNVKKCQRTKVYKRILFFNLAMVLLLTLSVPISTYAAYQGAKAIYEKVKSINMTNNEIENLDKQIKEEGFTEDSIGNLNELKKNENGQTYGPDILGADLVEVEMDNGQVGYVYREQLNNSPKNLDEAKNVKDKMVLDAYKSDGKTKIGEFTLSKSDEK